MPRPSEEGTPRNVNYGPSAAPSYTTDVVAPLDVEAAPTQAAMLAGALGRNWQQAQPALNEMARQQAVHQVQQGEMAAATGNVDPEKFSMATAYADGVERVHAQQRAITAVQAAREFAAKNPNLSENDTVNPDGTRVPGLVTSIDNIFRASFPTGAEQSPAVAAAAAGTLERGMSEIVTEARQRVVDRTRQQALDNATTLAASQAAADHMDENMEWSKPAPKLFDYSAQLDTLTKLVGGNTVGAQALLSQALIDKAVASHDSAILGMIQPEPGADALSPELQLKMSEAAQRIRVLKAGDYAQTDKAAQATIMDNVLAGKDPTAALHQYLTQPGADPHFAESAMSFFHSLGTDRATDQVDTGAAAGVIANVAGGQLTTPAQILGAVNASGIGGKAKSQLLDKALSTLRSVQSTDVDNPAVKAGVDYLSSTYKPGQDPLTGKLLNPAQLNQQSGAVLDYRTEVQSMIKQGQPAEQAAAQALQNIRKKWGDPLESGKSFSNRPLPSTDLDMASWVKGASTDPKAFMHSGITGQNLMQLRALGIISPDEAAQAATILNSQYHK